jgi:hypothetical protein
MAVKVGMDLRAAAAALFAVGVLGSCCSACMSNASERTGTIPVASPSVPAARVSTSSSSSVEPVALNGPYNFNYDGSRQTKNGAPAPRSSFSVGATFHTTCSSTECVGTLDGPAATFNIRFSGGWWEVIDGPPLKMPCDGGGDGPAKWTSRFSPNPDGTLSGTATSTVTCQRQSVELVLPARIVPAG